MLTTKQCTQCKEIKETTEYHKSPKNKDGLTSKCKICRNYNSKIYRDLNKEDIAKKRENNKGEHNKRKRELYSQNKEKILSRNKEWQNNNKEKISAYKKIYRENNKNELNIKQRERYKKDKHKLIEYQKEYRENNKEKIAKTGKEYRENNKEKVLQKQKEWYLKKRHTEEYKISRRNSEAKRRYLKKNSTDGIVPMIITFPLVNELQELLDIQNNKCYYCNKELIEKDLDHHVPLSKGGTHTIDNVVWLCPSCNRSKWAKVPDKLLLI